jgi:hypothetical protein
VGDAVTWVAFTDAAAFAAFHDAACADHGIPHPGRNAATGDVDPAAQWTTAYVDPVDDAGTIKANVTADDVTTYGLTVTDAPTAPTVPAWEWHKAPGDRLLKRSYPDGEQD